MKKILEASYFVVEAENGQEGLLAAATLKPSVIVLDLGLPDINGEEVLAKLRENPDTLGLPVLVATSRMLSSAEQANLHAQSAAVMSKHDLNDHLLAAVTGVIGV